MQFLTVAASFLGLTFLLYELSLWLFVSFYLKRTHWIEIFTDDINHIIDHSVWCYFFIVILILIYYSCSVNKRDYVNVPMTKKRYPKIQNWKDTMQGTWHQFDAENLDEFAALSEQSQIRRTLGSIAFFKVRHTITISDGYFSLQRDLGVAVSVWNLRAKIGCDRETAESVCVSVETGGQYMFKVWIDESSQELHMESCPADNQPGVATLQTRSLLSKDLMLMRWSGVHNVTGGKCEMVSYFERVLEFKDY
mmetsp:Transcript_9085/g.13669  ORF Transcript_9085/g.13669 Transcript_9085/m.13669 type:complete len:251 (+) Transcript_9085:51-803(+)